MAFKLGVAAIALMACSSAFSAVTISVPEEIKLLAVNDQEIRSGLFSSAQQVKVNAGENVSPLSSETTDLKFLAKYKELPDAKNFS